MDGHLRMLGAARQPALIAGDCSTGSAAEQAFEHSQMATNGSGPSTLHSFIDARIAPQQQLSACQAALFST